MKKWQDDIRPAPDGSLQTYTERQTIDVLKSGGVTELSVDHDLGDENVVGTGYGVLLWIEDRVATTTFVPPTLYVHSANTSAAEKMQLAIMSIKRLTSKRR